MAALVAAGMAVSASCSDEADSSLPSLPATTEAATTEPPPTDPPTTEPVTDPPTSPATTEATTTSSSTTSTSTTTVPPTTTTTTALRTTVPPSPVPGQPNPACIAVVAPGESLDVIVAHRNDPAVTVEALALENGIADVNVISAGASLDVCPGNGIDDLTGSPRVPPTTPPPTAPPPAPAPVQGLASGVEAQQQKLNELFGPYGMRRLDVDGVSGRMTRQLLCAARLSLGLPVSREDMAPGSPEEQWLMASTGLLIPPGAPVQAGRWALVDEHCQVMFTGEGNARLVFVFPTSTGTDEFPTRDQNASRSFRYDPAPENGGWHDSADYPASVDNPLNGNMYKPIYFDGGLAIHGANTVPTAPASHGCARLRIADQDALIAWLGLQDVTRQLWDNRSQIGLTVTITGQY